MIFRVVASTDLLLTSACVEIKMSVAGQPRRLRGVLYSKKALGSNLIRIQSVSGTIRRKIVITNELGLHLRPLAKIVAIAESYPKCDLKVLHDGVAVNGKSIVGMMMLAAGKGSVVEFCAAGDGAAKLLDELEALARANFHE